MEDMKDIRRVLETIQEGLEVLQKGVDSGLGSSYPDTESIIAQCLQIFQAYTNTALNLIQEAENT